MPAVALSASAVQSAVTTSTTASTAVVIHAGTKAWKPPAVYPRKGPGPTSRIGRRALAALTRRVAPWHVSKLVSVDGGFEAAAWTNAHGSGGISFWRWIPATESWHRMGRSTVPVFISHQNHCIRQVTGGHLLGAPHAVFIAYSWCLTGDAWDNFVAFADGPLGWGLAHGTARVMSSAGQHPPESFQEAYATHYWMRFSHGLLVTDDGSAFFFHPPTPFPVLTYWGWSRGHLVNVHDTVFTGVAAPVPDPTSPPELPAGACPSEGTYRASFGVDDFGNEGFFSPLHLLVFPAADEYPRIAGCTRWIVANLPITVHVARSLNPDEPESGKTTNPRWVTAPAWTLLLGLEGFDPPLSLVESIDPGESAWQLPAKFGANELLTDVGDANLSGFAKDNGRPPHPASGTVTFRHGKVVTVAVTS